MATHEHDVEVIAPLVAEYLEWLLEDSGRPPEQLLGAGLTGAQRTLLLERMDDCCVVYGLTAAARKSSTCLARVVRGLPQ